MDAAELASTYGSPLYTYELASIRTAYGMLRKALPAPSHLYYSLKANPHPKIVSQLVQLGCRCEVSSIGELRIALQNYEHTGDYAQILYTGPGKAR
ncbi:MAG TPA: hypothetical protein VFV38_37705, partial [Ktedonobacteraceae bacterium]|nr:hypothetical protein [Ktedonobacteraceae bacterium]